MDYKPYGTANTVLIGLQLDISNSILFQYGTNTLNPNAWTYINLSTSYTTITYSVVAQHRDYQDGAYWGLLQSSQPYTESQIKISTAMNSRGNCYWISMGF